jgi:hypothetical protein
VRLVAKIDSSSGNFLEDVLLEDGEPLPSGCVEQRPPEGFYTPRWSGSGWVEGKTPSEVLEAAKASKHIELKVAFRERYEPTFEAGFLEVDYLIDRLRRNLTVPQAERDRLAAAASGIDRLRTLLQQVNAATTVAEVEAIRW